jgi:hypothetical protein
MSEDPMGLPDSLWAFEDRDRPGACYRDQGIVYPGEELEAARRTHTPEMGTEYVRSDAMPTKAQIDRLVDAMIEERNSAHGRSLVSIEYIPIYRESVRATLYRAAGIEVPDGE